MCRLSQLRFHIGQVRQSQAWEQSDRKRNPAAAILKLVKVMFRFSWVHRHHLRTAAATKYRRHTTSDNMTKTCLQGHQNKIINNQHAEIRTLGTE